MMRRVQLSCSTFWVDVRVAIIDGRWVASADTPDGLSTNCLRASRTASAGARQRLRALDAGGSVGTDIEPETRGVPANRRSGKERSRAVNGGHRSSR
jgi:hypothetical protein